MAMVERLGLCKETRGRHDRCHRFAGRAQFIALARTMALTAAKSYSGVSAFCSPPFAPSRKGWGTRGDKMRHPQSFFLRRKLGFVNAPKPPSPGDVRREPRTCAAGGLTMGIVNLRSCGRGRRGSGG